MTEHKSIKIVIPSEKLANAANKHLMPAAIRKLKEKEIKNPAD